MPDNRKIIFRSENRPPTIRDVKIYFSQKGMTETEAYSFYQFYEKRKWKTKNGIFITKWKDFAYRWIAAIVQDQPLLFDRRIH